MTDKTRLSRRELLGRLAHTGVAATLGSAVMSLGGPVAGDARAACPPNILIILIDDLAAGIVEGHRRYPFLRAPHIERLGREGARFANAFVTTSLCSPSRASLYTGLYAHSHNVRVNDTQELDPTLPNLPMLLQGAGYETAFVGKWHMVGKEAGPRLNFDYWLSFRGQGVYEDPVFNENGHEVQAQGYITDLLDAYALRWLERPRKAPFFMVVSHKANHQPFTPATRHQHAFTHRQLDAPANFGDTFEGKPAWQRKRLLCSPRTADYNACEEDIPALLPPTPWEPFEPTLRDYLRVALSIDESVGRLVQALEDQGELDNTVVLFTSDNGSMLGEHRFDDKRVAYEASLRVPLIVRYPEQIVPGTTLSKMALNIDIAPTLLALAGVAVPKTMQGHSLLPLFQGNPKGWRESFLYEYFQERQYRGIPHILAVRSERYKYVCYPELDDGSELYDLRRDPLELTNLYSDRAHADTLAHMQQELRRLLRETGYVG